MLVGAGVHPSGLEVSNGPRQLTEPLGEGPHSVPGTGFHCQPLISQDTVNRIKRERECLNENPLKGTMSLSIKQD